MTKLVYTIEEAAAELRLGGEHGPGTDPVRVAAVVQGRPTTTDRR